MRILYCLSILTLVSAAASPSSLFTLAKKHATSLLLAKSFPEQTSELESLLATPLDQVTATQDFSVKHIASLCSSISQLAQTTSLAFVDFFGVSVRKNIKQALKQINAATPLLKTLQALGKEVARATRTTEAKEVADALTCVQETKVELKRQKEESRELGMMEICMVVFVALIGIYGGYLFWIPRGKLIAMVEKDDEGKRNLV